MRAILKELDSPDIDFENYLPFSSQTVSDMTLQIQLQMQEMHFEHLSECGLKQLLLFSFRQAEHQRIKPDMRDMRRQALQRRVARWKVGHTPSVT